jgi:hypothetical protein
MTVYNGIVIESAQQDHVAIRIQGLSKSTLTSELVFTLPSRSSRSRLYTDGARVERRLRLNRSVTGELAMATRLSVAKTVIV